MSKWNQHNNMENESNENKINIKPAKTILHSIILLAVLTLGMKWIGYDIVSVKDEKSKDEIILDYEQQIEKLNKNNKTLKENNKTLKENNNSLENQITTEKINHEFEDLFKHKFIGKYEINGEEGDMSLKFDDTLYGSLEFSVDYTTTSRTKELIDNGNAKIVYPKMIFKLDDMDKTNKFITIKGFEIIKPKILNQKDEVLDCEFKMIDGKEFRLLDLRVWFVESDKIVGDILDEDDNIIGNFNMTMQK